MNKSYKIKLNPLSVENTEIKVKLEQNIETFEFLTMTLDTKEVYANFNADYGVLVGRVTANGGLGIPNAKVSIFIPLSEEDERNRDVKSIYPYKLPTDKNNQGKRYNLLPRVSQIDPNTGNVKPKQPFGSFPIKPEVITNSKLLNVHKKYYKYTATTNYAGDYMIFGVPVGVQTVHMSVDITDIGEFSMNPASMVTNLGYSPNLFTDNNIRIKESNDLDDLPHIETQEISVDIIPFWGDVENFEIGITQQNFRIRASLNTTFTIFGSVFTDGDNAMFGENKYSGSRRIGELFSARDRDENSDMDTVGMATKRIGIVSEKIYYYPPDITDFEINNGTVDPARMLLLDNGEYTAYKRDGDFVFIINCNRNKVTRNENGEEISVPFDSNVGVFSEFRGFIIIEYTENEIPMLFTGDIGNDTRVTPYRFKLKFPQFANRNQGFNMNDDDLNTKKWKNQSYTFEYNKFYSLSRFHGLTYNGTDNTDTSQFPLDNGFLKNTQINIANRFRVNGNRNGLNNVGLIITNNLKLISLNEEEDGSPDYEYPNGLYEFPHNSSFNGKVVGDDNGSVENIKVFGANWMNLSIYLPQLGYLTKGRGTIRDVYTADNFTPQYENDNSRSRFFLFDNTQSIAAGDFNTRFMARSDLHWTDIIEVPINDIRQMQRIPTKGFKDNITINGDILNLSGNYRNGKYIPNGWNAACPINGGKVDGHPDNSPDERTYFYKGFNGADCINYLFELGLIA